MPCSVEQLRLVVGCFHIWHGTKLASESNWIYITLISFILLLKCGDFQPNPGPQRNISVCHTNIRSLLAGVDLSKDIQSQNSKLDEVYACLAVDNNYDIITLSKTWLSSRIDSNDISFPGYQLPFRSDMNGRGGRNPNIC